RSAEKAQASMKAIDKSLTRAVDKGRATEDEKSATLGNLSATGDIADLKDVDLVIEALAEDMDLKLEIFKQLDQTCGEHTILSTTTSSLSVTDIAMATERPTKVIGLHFFNPAPAMKLVEVVPTLLTDEDLTEGARKLCEQLGKVPVVAKDRAGFIVNALLFPYLNQAVRMLEAGYASREDIDAAMQNGCAHPMGPLALLDLVGNDTSLEIIESLYSEFRDPFLAPAPLLKQMVSAGLLGRKTGRGFYDYSK
ncbi:MAG: 3-hydroxyacyl-CoA dehydrogenase NAD-binding domain-containing protein, partial [Actinomycetota bacterium]